MLVKERISRIDTKDTPIFFHETPLPKHEFQSDDFGKIREYEMARL